MGAPLRRLARLAWDNPILLKELRVGLRERKIFVLQTLYLAVLGAATALFLVSTADDRDFLELAEQGRALHLVLFWCQLVMVVLITPSLTCGQVSGEREARTLELLEATRLRTREIVAGKLGYALAFVGLLLCSSLPMVAVVFLLGGVSPLELVESYLVLLATAALAGLLGLYYSAREKRTLYATNQTYGSLILLGLVAIPAVAGLDEALGHGLRGQQAPVWALLGGNALAVLLFLFLKAQNHLRRKAGHEVWLGRLFLAWYMGNMLALGLGAASAVEAETVAVLWMLGLVGALVALGSFLDPQPFASPHDEAVRRRALGFRWWFWVLVLFLGFVLVGALHVAGQNPLELVLLALGLVLTTLLAFAAVPRAVVEFSGRRWRMAPVYYLLLVAAVFLPLLGLIHLGPDGLVGFWTGSQLSPALAIFSVWSREAPRVTLAGTTLELASATVLSYLALAMAALLALGAGRALGADRALGAGRALGADRALGARREPTPDRDPGGGP